MASSFLRFLDHTWWDATVGRTALEEWSACHRPLPDNTQYLHTSIPLTGFEPTIPASEQLQTHALDCMATGISYIKIYRTVILLAVSCVLKTHFVSAREGLRLMVFENGAEGNSGTYREKWWRVVKFTYWRALYLYVLSWTVHVAYVWEMRNYEV